MRLGSGTVKGAAAAALAVVGVIALPLAAAAAPGGSAGSQAGGQASQAGAVSAQAGGASGQSGSGSQANHWAVQAQWAGLQQTALSALKTYHHTATASVASVVAAPATAPLTTYTGGVKAADGASAPATSIQSQDEVVQVTDGTGTYEVDISLLGGQQEVVHILADNETTLVLSPGTATITEVLNSAGTPLDASDLAKAAASQAAGGSAAAAQATAALQSGYCFGSMYAPEVIGSIYGPLIDGQVGVGCWGDFTVAELGSTGEWVGSVKQIASAGGTVYGSSYYFNLYAPCYNSYGATNYFITGLLFDVDGGSLVGGSSGWSGLGCALL